MAGPEVRVVTVRPATVLTVLGITALVVAGILLAVAAWHVLTWILIAMFLAAALNPAVVAFEQRGMRRGTAGRGPLGFLQDDYQLVDRIREAIDRGGAAGVLGLSAGLVDVVRSVITAVVGLIAIIFLTFFMLLEGPRTVERVLSLLPDGTRLRYERVGTHIYRTISGYVTGNLLISLIAGVTSTAVLFAVGSEFAIALGLIVAVFDLIPLPGATLAALLVSTVILIETDWLRFVIVVAFFIAYQQLENHVLQPLVYGRTVQLSPLAVLCAVLIGAELAGIFGALLAIPVAGSLLAVGREVLLYRRESAIETPPGVDVATREAE